MTQTEYLIAGIRHICNKTISEDELHQIKRCFLDWVGVSFAGASITTNKLRPILEIAADGICSSFVSNRKLDIHSATFLNGYVSHVLELDDGHRYGMLHLEAPIFSALWGVAQQEKIDFEHFIKGILVGYQTTVQLARRIQPEHKKNGYHATGTCGAIGVACAIAVALGLDDSQLTSAIGAAVTRASGLLSALDAPSEIKPYNVSAAVESGVMSAYLARCGFVVQADPIYGKRGFLKMYTKNKDFKSLYDFGDISEIMNIYFKPYAACRHCHAPVECALRLKNTRLFNNGDIKEIRVETYKLAIDGHDHREVLSSGSAKMSIPYCVAVSLINGRCGMDAFSDDTIFSSEVISLTNKVTVEEDEIMTSLTPNKRGARVSITTNSGKTFTAEVDNPLGEPENPMSDKMLDDKFYDMMKFASIDDSRIKSLNHMIWNLERDYEKLLTLL